MLYKWGIEALWGVQISRIGPSHHVEYFFRNFSHGGSDEKVDLGNKKRPSVQGGWPQNLLNILLP